MRALSTLVIAIAFAIGCGGAKKDAEEPDFPEEETVDDDGNPVADETESTDELPVSPPSETDPPGEDSVTDPDAEDVGDDGDEDEDEDGDDAIDEPDEFL